MNWEKLMSEARLRRPDALRQEGRSNFQQDIDRIVFSAPFRRLAHKTQVHPLSQNDHVHTRLTHSVEVASVGRSLGTIVGTEIVKRLQLCSPHPSAFGDVMAAACLAHDIGNPPFGHAGEEAIRTWFSTNCAAELELAPSEASDFKNFDGNAQGFRILTNLENCRFAGGLQLTFATLGAFTKYPSAWHASSEARQKIGIFQSELVYFREIAPELGLVSVVPDFAWCRHPLALLLEAADDICYSVIDIEDAFVLGYIDFRNAVDLLEPIAQERYDRLPPEDEIGKLRAVAIGHLVRECAQAFLNNFDEIMTGGWSHELLECTMFASQVNAAKKAARDRVFLSKGKAKLEIAGTEIVWGLLDTFSKIVFELQKNKFDQEKLSPTAQRLARLHDTDLRQVNSTYEAMLTVIDSISAMTDRYALDLYRALRGISF